MKNYVLKVTHLEKRYHKFLALQDVTMTIEQGAIYGLIGKNGAGKTTVIRIISGLQKPTGGDYVLYGCSYKERGIVASRRRMSAIVETPAVYLNMTAKDNLILQDKIFGRPTTNNVESILELVGLNHTGKKKVKHFSLGMRQRLGIAIALTTNSDFLILDEPINGLDPQGIIEMRELILKLNKEKGITILISSHYLDELSKIVTHYGFLDQGKIVREVSRDKLNEGLKKRIDVTVNNALSFVQFLEENKMTYEVIKDNEFTLFGDVNMSSIILELAKRDCVIQEFHEHKETLETYFMNLIGGNQK